MKGRIKLKLFRPPKSEQPGHQKQPLSIKNVQNVPFLTQSQKPDIFYSNAVRFFKLNKKDVGGK